MADSTSSSRAQGSPAWGAKVTLLGQLVRSGSGLLGIVVLARMLSPSDFGLLAMVATIISLGELLRDMGLSTAAIRAREISHQQSSNLFWASSCIGLALTLLMIGCAPAIARFYRQPALAAVASVMSVVFLLNGLAAQHRANANRNMHFLQLAIIDAAPPVVGLLMAMACALQGLGIWALVAQQVSAATLGLLLAWTLVPWRPKCPTRGSNMGQFYRFGLPLVGVQVLGYLSRNIDTAVMGLRFGAAATGVYDRAFQIAMMPLNQFNAPSTRVALPVLARALDEEGRVTELVERGQRVLIHPVACLLFLLLATSPLGIPIILGDDWRAAVPFIQILAIGALAQTAAYSSYWVFLSHGRTGSNLLYSLVSRPIVIACILVGSSIGPIGVACGYALGLILIWPLAYFWIRGFPGIDGMRLFRSGLIACVTYVPATVMTLLAEFGVQKLGAQEVAVFAIGIVFFTVCVTITIFLLSAARESWRLIFSQVVRGRH